MMTVTLQQSTTSAVVEARRRGAFTAEINLDQTPASDSVDVAIQGAAEDILPAIAQLL